MPIFTKCIPFDQINQQLALSELQICRFTHSNVKMVSSIEVEPSIA